MRHLPGLLLFACFGCHSDKGDSSVSPKAKSPINTSSVDEKPPPEPPVVRDTSDGLVFSWAHPEKGYATGTRVQDVPPCCRKDVVIADLTRSPLERQAHRYVMIADLSEPKGDGSYPVVVLSRYQFKDTDLSDTGPNTNDGVIVYTTVWCGFCTKLKRWLDQRGVRYQAKDIEKDPKAGLELQAKLRKSGLQAGGVPVTDIKGTLIQGFAKARLQKALEEAGL
ncbi:MAG: glutaredoxin family protein [Myxococcota bacterium]|nr:glutaredoxin family protein [Myxococcota bacterium]